MIMSDIGYINEITRRTLDEYFPKEIFSLFMTGWPAGQLTAIDYSGIVMGYIAGIRISPDKAKITLFAVDKEYRYRGIGTELLNEFRIKAFSEGIRTIILEVRNTNVRTISFYEKRGFFRTENLKNFYNDGGDAIRMISFMINNA
jgi:Acetyltransferases